MSKPIIVLIPDDLDPRCHNQFKAGVARSLRLLRGLYGRELLIQTEQEFESTKNPAFQNRAFLGQGSPMNTESSNFLGPGSPVQAGYEGIHTE